MIFITGDTHRALDIGKLANDSFDYSCLTRDDYVIICGDFGFVWFCDERDKAWLDWLGEKPCTFLFIDGNHDNHAALAALPTEKIFGGKAHRVSENIIHLMRGQVYTIEGRRFFTFGGGESIDRHLRHEGRSWWPQEMPSEKEYTDGILNLQKASWQVDYVLSHVAPQATMQKIASYFGGNRLNRYLQYIDDRLEYKQWYFGHYHFDRKMDEKHTGIFNRIIKID